MEEDGEEVDDNRVEKIHEEVFDAPQPTQQKRTMDCTKVEDVAVVRAWVCVFDAVTDNEQTRQKY